MDQDFYVGRSVIEGAWSWRFDGLNASMRSCDYEERRNVVDSTQREHRAVIVIHRGGMMRCVMLEKPVGRQMAMDERVNLPVVLSLVHMLGRRDGHHPHRHAQHAGQHSGHPHDVDRMPSGQRRTTEEIRPRISRLGGLTQFLGECSRFARVGS